MGLPLQLCAIFLALAGAILGSQFLSFVSVFLLWPLYLRAKKETRNRPMQAAHWAERIYFTGYLCTLVGLAALGVKIGLDKTFVEDLAGALKQGGFALSSTVVALFLMTLLNSEVQPESSVEERFSQAVESLLKRVTESDSERTKAFLEALSSSGFSRVLEEAASQIQANSEGLTRLQTVSESSVRFLEELNTQLHSLQGHLKQLGVVANKHATPIRVAAENSRAIELIASRLSELSERSVEAERSFGNLAKQTADLNSAVGALSQLPDAGAQLRSLVGSLGDAANLLAAHGKTLHEVQVNAERVPELLSRLTSLAGVFETLEQRLRDGGHSAKDFTSSMSGVRKALDDFVHVTTLRLK